MCRLYGFRANEPTKVECSLVHAQNALMVQSRGDMEGKPNAHGWGVATYENHAPRIERQAWAAFHGEHFRRAASRIYSQTVLAHVRRATVGPPGPQNTHPFADGRWAFIHNGTVPRFDQIRPMMLAALHHDHCNAISGATDSEHIFRLVLSLHDDNPERPILDTLRTVLRQIVAWSREMNATDELGLNVILTDGENLVGTRLGRSLYCVEREGVTDCEICGFPHIHHDPNRPYRAVILASEPITHENWREVPEHSIYAVTPDMTLHIEPV